jgi:hypothetical protein
MSTPRNTELRVVGPAATDADSSRATLRIDAERPVPAPSPSAAETHAVQLAGAEKELDRLHQAVTTEQLALGQHVNWLIASQAIFIHAYLMVFVISAMGVVALSHWLLGGLALVGILCALALQGSVDRSARTLAMLILQRRAVEAELATLSGRVPNLPKESSKFAGWPGPLFVVAWLGLLAFSAAMRF